ncbi:hypothetical protein D3C73_655650 [compost metagenome]
MDQNCLPTKHHRDADLLAMLGVTTLFQFILPNRDTAYPWNIISIGQFDCMADFFTLIGDCSISSLYSIFPLEQQDMFCLQIVE